MSLNELEYVRQQLDNISDTQQKLLYNMDNLSKSYDKTQEVLHILNRKLEYIINNETLKKKKKEDDVEEMRRQLAMFQNGLKF